MHKKFARKEKTNWKTLPMLLDIVEMDFRGTKYESASKGARQDHVGTV